MELETIQVRVNGGQILEATGYRWQEFMVLEDLLGWTIVFVPLGTSFGGFYWPKPEPAIEAMKELARLKNYWGDCTLADFRAMASEIIEVLKRRNGKELDTPIAVFDLTPINGFGG